MKNRIPILKKMYILENLQSFSEQQLVSCDYYCGGCGGGWAEAGITYFAKNGVYPESVYPYTSGNGYVAPCQSPGTPLTGVVSGYKSLPSGDENSLKDASATIGPISIAIDASQPSFQVDNQGTGSYFFQLMVCFTALIFMLRVQTSVRYPVLRLIRT